MYVGGVGGGGGGDFRGNSLKCAQLVAFLHNSN